jgi:hypothetical protein
VSAAVLDTGNIAVNTKKRVIYFIWLIIFGVRTQKLFI